MGRIGNGVAVGAAFVTAGAVAVPVPPYEGAGGDDAG